MEDSTSGLKKLGPAIAVGLLLVGGCGGGEASPALDPRAALEDAASVTLDEEALAVRLTAASGPSRFMVAGLLEPRTGRSRFEVERDTTEFELPRLVIGTDGEGPESTYSELRGGTPGIGALLGARKRCWFNPHGPVGSSGETISVEESTRLLGAILESLPSEVVEVDWMTSGGGSFGDSLEVRLADSAARPRDGFEKSKRRVWGARALLANLAGPIEVELGEDGGVGRMELELRDYAPFVAFGSGRVGPVSVEASIHPATRRLAFDRPSCQAIE